MIIVAGPAFAGKSTFIKEHFPKKRIIDLFDFQKGKSYTIPVVLQSYEDCKNELIQAIQNGEDVVLEHTLLKAIRRKPYIDAIREVTDEDIDIYFIVPNEEEWIERGKKRGLTNPISTIKDAKDVMELPTVEEGFAHVHIIRN